jgi:multicomponent Na+:H+ antiporter subunit E
MRSRLQHEHRYMPYFLLTHLLLIIALPAFFTVFGGIWDYLIVLLLGVLVLAAVDYHYAIYLFWTIAFLLYLIKELVVSNVTMAWLVIQPNPKVDPGIIGVPLTATSDLEITALAISVVLTPGTLVIELGKDKEGRGILYVHSINVGDPEAFRASIQNGFERMILNITRGAPV